MNGFLCVQRYTLFVTWQKNKLTQAYIVMLYGWQPNPRGAGRCLRIGRSVASLGRRTV